MDRERCGVFAAHVCEWGRAGLYCRCRTLTTERKESRDYGPDSGGNGGQKPRNSRESFGIILGVSERSLGAYVVWLVFLGLPAVWRNKARPGYVRVFLVAAGFVGLLVFATAWDMVERFVLSLLFDMLT